MGLLAFILAWVNSELLLRKSLYIGMLVLLVASSFGLPLPEDVPLLLGGCLCRLGYGEVYYAILTGLTGVLFGDFFLYALGRRFGMGVLEMRPARYLVTRTHVAQMKLIFRRWGHVIIFFGRFFAGVRSVMCLTAGVCRVPVWKFVFIDVSGAMITVPLLIGLGWWFSHSIARLAHGMAAIQHVLGGVAAAGIVGWVIYLHFTRTRRKAIERRLEREHQRTLAEGAANDAADQEEAGPAEDGQG